MTSPSKPNVIKAAKQFAAAQHDLEIRALAASGGKTKVPMEVIKAAEDRRRKAISRREKDRAIEAAAVPAPLREWAYAYLRRVARSVGMKEGSGNLWMRKLAGRFGIELIPESEIGGQKHVALQLALDLEAISGVRSWRPKSYIPFGVKASQK